MKRVSVTPVVSHTSSNVGVTGPLFVDDAVDDNFVGADVVRTNNFVDDK